MFPTLLLLWACVLAVSGDNATYVPRDVILLNCGATRAANDSLNRVWTGDAGSLFIPATPNGVADGATAASQDPSLPSPVPYMTARVFTQPFTYSFPLTAGTRIFIRLYFYPSTYAGRAASDALFSVASAGTLLLSNFSASQTAQALNYAYLIQEFSVNSTSAVLNLTFAPAASNGAYAFINGIEIVSSPDLFTAKVPDLVTGSNPMQYPIDPSSSFQTMYRLNVGGQAISPTQDSGLYRSWGDDSEFIWGAGFGVSFDNDPNVTITYPATLPQYIAPTDVYATARSMGPNAQINLNYNLTWILPVDAGFYYLVRFHFCEIQYPITKPNQRVFFIYLSNQTAQQQADVILWSGGIGVPVYQDYVITPIPGAGSVDLWVALHPDLSSKTEYYDAILNGLEVFKIQNSNNSLAGLNPELPPQPDFQPGRAFSGLKSSKISVAAVAGGVVGGVVLLLVTSLCVYIVCVKRKKKVKSASNVIPTINISDTTSSDKTNTTRSHGSTLPSNLCRVFLFEEIRAATNNFDEARLLGVGGFGKVYRGEIEDGCEVAIKRGNPMSEQGVHEFETEIVMLSKLRHRHLVSLIGYCEEKNEMILVYDYMAHGTLREHLYKTENTPLPWRQRLEICIGAARGLHYLHTGAKYPIIHRDVKTTNILLDEKWVAKVSDFGLSKTGPDMDQDQTHVSTMVKGSFGYLDPEYFRRQQLTDKSDVYSFGVVLFEVLCARPALDTALPREQVSLAEWALHCKKKGILDEIIDPCLAGKIAPECLKKFAETAEKCIADEGIARPSMGDVLWSLEFALGLQESAESSGSIFGGMSEVAMNRHVDVIAPSSEASSTGTTSLSMGGRSIVGSEDESDRMTVSAVFSQIMNPKGR